MNNPFYNSNKRGIPTIATTAVTTSDGTVSLVLPNRTFWGAWFQGIILLEITQSLADVDATSSILLSVNGETRPLTLPSGDAATAANVTGDGAVFQVYYDKPRNLLQLMTMLPSAASLTNAGQSVATNANAQKSQSGK